MKKLNVLALMIASSLTVLAAPSAFAYDAGDWVVRVGTATVDPKSSSDDIDQIPGQRVTANNNTQLGISGTYMLNEKLGIEVLGSTPFTHDVSAKGGSLAGASVGKIKHLPPTVSAQYYPMGTSGKLKPYIGAGLNYTIFFDEKTGADIEGLGYDKLSLDNSVGLAAQVGVDYQINKKWFLNASAMYADINTKATLTGPGVDNLTVDYDLDPMVYRVNVGFKF